MILSKDNITNDLTTSFIVGLVWCFGVSLVWGLEIGLAVSLALGLAWCLVGGLEGALMWILGSLISSLISIGLVILFKYTLGSWIFYLVSLIIVLDIGLAIYILFKINELKNKNGK